MCQALGQPGTGSASPFVVVVTSSPCPCLPFWPCLLPLSPWSSGSATSAFFQSSEHVGLAPSSRTSLPPWLIQPVRQGFRVLVHVCFASPSQPPGSTTLPKPLAVRRVIELLPAACVRERGTSLTGPSSSRIGESPRGRQQQPRRAVAFSQTLHGQDADPCCVKSLRFGD